MSMSTQIASDETSASKAEAQSLAELFHLVRSIVPEGQEVVSASPEMTVARALQLMRKHNFSQLPVVAGDDVLGVFSFRSLTMQLLEMGPMKEHFGDLPVDEFMEQFRFVQPSDTWESLLSYLDSDDGVLVGRREQLEGLVTSMDVLSYLRNIASPFVMLAEIELSLRRIIQACVSDDELQVCIKNSLTPKYSQNEMPPGLSEMTFNDYVQIVGDGRNWPRFSVAFGKGEWQRKTTAERLKEVRDLRNDVFHFKRKLTSEDRERLAARREWLQWKTRAFEAKTPIILDGSAKPTPEDYHRLLTRIPVSRGQQQLYKALYDAGDDGLTYGELVEKMGRRDRRDLGGALGALGRRINLTPGYGQGKKPGTSMVLSWEELGDGKWRLRLLPEMRAALESLNPSWLHKMTP
jgi:CBS domain-containing protein